MAVPHLIGRIIGADIRSERDLRRFVVRLMGLCVAAALAVDVINQLTFFAGWEASIRSWIISALVAMAISLPVGVAVGRAYLALFRAKEEVLELSRRDPLTGLLNRRALLESAEQPPECVVLIIVDIDRFKPINDTHGHLVGDDAIRIVARTMQDELGDFGLVGRLGGEEFALVSPEPVSDAMMARLWRFRDHIAALPIIAGEVVVHVTISAGVAQRHPGQPLLDLYRAADRALYAAKAGGRNQIVVDSNLDPDLAVGASTEESAQAHERRAYRG